MIPFAVLSPPVTPGGQGCVKTRRALATAVTLIPALSLYAQNAESTASADLGALLREAEARNPALQAASVRLEAARRIPSQAQALPDPEASIGYLNEGLSQFTLGESEFSNVSFTWTQEVPYPGKLKRSGEVAERDIEISARALDRLRLEIRSKVKNEYGELYRLDRTRAILEETRAILDSLAQAARRRYEVGEGIQESVLKAQTEILRLETELARVDQDRAATEARLNAALGHPASAPIGPAQDLPGGGLPDDPEALADSAVGASPAIAALQAAVRRGMASVERARLDLKPDFTWSASYQYLGDLDPMVSAMFGLRLPVYRERKQAQAVAQAESELAAARHDLVDLELQTRASVRDLVARVRRAERLLALIGQGVIPQARGALESAQAAYGVGRIGFLDLLNDLIVLLNARIDFAAQESERIQSLADLEPLLNREIVFAPESPGIDGGNPR
jgi:outer membrane protein TolC